ncbi:MULTISPECIES: ATP-binding cassette domain-containing protein [Mesorhizobium]|uniref:iron ABC transporter ATP-binding protein n=1 Tax=Mesorhizobium sp. TaxID=1871066 RepID=UPI000494B0A6|nr:MULTISPECIES: ATP-binding cassette domain-containing protein [Mesorhizobium]RWM75564.1 MAG: ATP-binding cassette domain-containing protein [Mesorhizobium sp.]TIO25172.1 MAG: ATP-binding cassette domain-containing protein [Mesorhizobium sp.]TJV58667.1 MAG: ATP-binding cassette domain-containing protein [Mesorhizobium sp.]
MIEIAGVSLALGGSRILDNVSLTVPKGGVTALVGPNGAGKSSLLSLIARLQPLQSGRITVDGLPVDTTPSRQLAKIVAILRQDPGVASRLRVVELVGFGRFPHHRGRLTAKDREMIAASLEQFDLSDLAPRFIDTLSGGQRQRALVAMTFCQGTDYILLDEPLNNLDMFHARNLMRTLRRIADEHGKTVLIVLHDINHAASYADRIVAMKDGAVVASGETGDVIKPDILESIFGFSMRVEYIAGRLTVLHHA